MLRGLLGNARKREETQPVSVEQQAINHGLSPGARYYASHLNQYLKFIEKEPDPQVRFELRAQIFSEFLTRAGDYLTGNGCTRELEQASEILKEAAGEIDFISAFLTNLARATIPRGNLDMDAQLNSLMRAVGILSIFEAYVPSDLKDFGVHFCIYNAEIPVMKRHAAAVRFAALRQPTGGLKPDEKRLLSEQLCAEVKNAQQLVTAYQLFSTKS